jgi:DNA helicase-2/ATP-dependent DNA helicase PcrA
MSLTIETLWKDFDFTPNDAQRDAILHTNGPLYMPAGPGSGKTRVLLWRAVNLIACRGVSADAIFLATFTEKAALQLREGLRTLLGAVTNHTDIPYDVDRMYVGTMHSLCQRLIKDRRFYRDRHVGRVPALLDELGQYFFVYQKNRWDHFADGLFGEQDVCEAINAAFGGTHASRHEAVTNWLSLFGRLSEECFSLDTFDPGPALADSTVALLEMYRRYLAELGERPVRTDFSLLQQVAHSLIASFDGDLPFEHVIVDEYQDTNTVQERLYFGLARCTGNLCVVGDDDQALYRFRGATVENFVQFPTRCEAALGKKPREIKLNINYRSRHGIVQFNNEFMRWCDWSKDGTGCAYTRPGPGPFWTSTSPLTCSAYCCRYSVGPIAANMGAPTRNSRTGSTMPWLAARS